jgi:hypothetical protein
MDRFDERKHEALLEALGCLDRVAARLPELSHQLAKQLKKLAPPAAPKRQETWEEYIGAFRKRGRKARARLQRLIEQHGDDRQRSSV